MADKKQMLIDILKMNAEIGPTAIRLGKAIQKNYTPSFMEHAGWYENQLPKELDAYAYDTPTEKGIGTFRLTGSPRDTAAEFAGAADYGRNGDLKQDLFNAWAHQAINNNPLMSSEKNRVDNFIQDQAGLKYGAQNPKATRKQIVKEAVKYGRTHDFGELPSFKENN
jgi:hypothetical protein